jgi:hypothetical protein
MMPVVSADRQLWRFELVHPEALAVERRVVGPDTYRGEVLDQK